MLNEKNTAGLGLKFCANWCLTSTILEVFLKNTFYYFVIMIIN